MVEEAVLMHRMPLPPTTVAEVTESVTLPQAPATYNAVPRQVEELEPRNVKVPLDMDEATYNVLPEDAVFVMTETPSKAKLKFVTAPPK